MAALPALCCGLQEDYDGAEPAASSIALVNLWRLAGLTSGGVSIVHATLLLASSRLAGAMPCPPRHPMPRSCLSTALLPSVAAAGGSAVAGEGRAVRRRVCRPAGGGSHRAAADGLRPAPADAGPPPPGGRCRFDPRSTLLSLLPDWFCTGQRLAAFKRLAAAHAPMRCYQS